METNTASAAPLVVDPLELDRGVVEMYRDGVTGAGGDLHFPTGRSLAETLGYPADLLDRLPAAAVSSFAGVGYPLGLTRLVPGERVLDLGCGSGIDAFAAAAQVRPDGSVTGVDIALERLARCERLRRDQDVSFHWARIEELPFEDGSFDAVISNGVINRSSDKPRVFSETARVLRPGGRLALADLVTERDVAARSACEAYLWAASIAKSSDTGRYLDQIAEAGLELQLVQDTPDHRVASNKPQRARRRYGAHGISLLALKPLPVSRRTSGASDSSFPDTSAPATKPSGPRSRRA